MISLTRMISQWRAVAVLAGLLTAMATNVATAHGGYNQGRRSQNVVVSRHAGVPVRHNSAKREYRRGYAAGKQAGYAAGYEAGSYRGWYDPSPTGCGKRRSRNYRNGYAAGYTKAYAQGYRLANRYQRHGRPSCRWW